MLKIPGLPTSRQDAKCSNNVSPAFFPFKSEFLSEFEDNLAAAIRSSARRKKSRNVDLLPSKERICGFEEFGRRRRREEDGKGGHVANDYLCRKEKGDSHLLQTQFQFSSKTPAQLAEEDSATLKKSTEKVKARKALAMAAQFPDLTVSSAEERRRRVYWQMPFRHDLYRQNEPAIQR